MKSSMKENRIKFFVKRGKNIQNGPNKLGCNLRNFFSSLYVPSPWFCINLFSTKNKAFKLFKKIKIWDWDMIFNLQRIRDLDMSSRTLLKVKWTKILRTNSVHHASVLCGWLNWISSQEYFYKSTKNLFLFASQIFTLIISCL